MSLLEKLAGFLHPQGTAEVHRAQKAHHALARDRVKEIFPAEKVREYTWVYKAMGEEAQFGIIAAYLRLVALNESERRNWSFVEEEALYDERLSEGDKDILFTLVTMVKARSTELAKGTERGAKATLEEVTAWKPSEMAPEEVAARMDEADAEAEAHVALAQLEGLVRSMETEKRLERERVAAMEAARYWVDPRDVPMWIAMMEVAQYKDDARKVQVRRSLPDSG